MNKVVILSSDFTRPATSLRSYAETFRERSHLGVEIAIVTLGTLAGWQAGDPPVFALVPAPGARLWRRAWYNPRIMALTLRPLRFVMRRRLRRRPELVERVRAADIILVNGANAELSGVWAAGQNNHAVISTSPPRAVAALAALEAAHR